MAFNHLSWRQGLVQAVKGEIEGHVLLVLAETVTVPDVGPLGVLVVERDVLENLGVKQARLVETHVDVIDGDGVRDGVFRHIGVVEELGRCDQLGQANVIPYVARVSHLLIRKRILEDGAT